MNNLSSNTRKVLITGVAGFIGFHLSRRLLAEGWQVIGIDVVNDYYSVSLKEDRLKILEAHPAFTFNRIDLCDDAAVRNVFQTSGIDSSVPVVHLAAQAGVRYGIQNPGAYIKSNVIGYFNMLESCRAVKSPHFLYASSSSVYGGNRKLPFTTHDNVDHPISFYAATKKSNELIAHVYSYTYGLPTTGLRFFTVYGPWGRPDMALFIFTKSILEGKPIPVYNDGIMFRDFTYIDDIVDGITRLIDRAPLGNSTWDGMTPDPATSWAPYMVYNIGNHRSEKLLDFISIIENAVGKKAIIDFQPLQTGDVEATYADIDDLQRDVGFVPKTTIREGIPKFVQWYQDYYKS